MTKEEMETLKLEVVELKLEVANLTKSVSDLVTAFQGAKGVLATIKWSAALGASIAGMIQLFRHWR